MMPFSEDALHAKESGYTYQSMPFRSVTQLSVDRAIFLVSDHSSRNQFGTECLKVFACIFRTFNYMFARLIHSCTFICFILEI